MGEVGKRWQEKGGKRKRKPQQVERRTGPLVSVSDPGTQQTTFRTHLWNDGIDRAHMGVIMSEGLSSLAETGLQGLTGQRNLSSCKSELAGRAHATWVGVPLERNRKMNDPGPP